MSELGITEGFSAYLTHSGPALPNWQRSLNGRLYSAVSAEQGWIMRLREGECVEWESKPVKRFDESGSVLVVISMLMGFGAAEYMPSGEFVLAINGQDVAEFCTVKYSTLWRQKNARFYFEVKRRRTTPETAVAGIGYLLLPSSVGLESGERLRMRLYNRKKSYTRIHNARVSDRWVRIDGVPRLEGNAFLDRGIEAVRGNPARPEWNGRKLFFGDLHSHCGRIESLHKLGETEFLRMGNCGIGQPMDYYHYAKYISRLDFYSLTDHHRTEKENPNNGLTREDWKYRLDMVSEWTAPDFAPIPGIELVKREGGHWNTYFREAAPEYPPPESTPFPELTDLLKKRYGIDNVMLVPHQTATYCGVPVNWELHDPELSPIVELYSHWGSNEYFGNPLQCREVDVNPNSYVSVALEQGRQLGFMASTDEHSGAPGDGVTFINPLGAGVACVWAPELDRCSIFDSLRDRYCYASTGARIDLRFTVNDSAMGRDIQSPDPARIRLSINAPVRINEVVLMKNSREFAFDQGRSESGEWEWIDETGSDRCPDYYYPRVTLEDGETAWGSPVWLTRT